MNPSRERTIFVGCDAYIATIASHEEMMLPSVPEPLDAVDRSELVEDCIQIHLHCRLTFLNLDVQVPVVVHGNRVWQGHETGALSYQRFRVWYREGILVPRFLSYQDSFPTKIPFLPRFPFYTRFAFYTRFLSYTRFLY